MTPVHTPDPAAGCGITAAIPSPDHCRNRDTAPLARRLGLGVVGRLVGEMDDRELREGGEGLPGVAVDIGNEWLEF